MKPKNLIIATGLISILAVSAFFYFQTRNVSGEQGSILTTESSVQLIPLTGPVADPKSELSGLAWHGGWLYLLPQYPERFGEDDGVLFRLDGDQIRSYLSGTGGSLTPDLNLKPLGSIPFPFLEFRVTDAVLEGIEFTMLQA